MSARKPPSNGKRESPPIEVLSPGEHHLPDSKLQALLQAAYDGYQKLDDPTANATARHDFVFHMTDWIGDLERLTALYSQPEAFDTDKAGDTVYAFLIHALPHLMEAGRLLEGRPIRNPFVDMTDEQ